MRCRASLFLLLCLPLSACLSSGNRESLQRIEGEMAERGIVKESWAVHEAGEEARLRQTIQKQLSGELSLDDAIFISLFENRKLRALYSQLGVEKSELFSAALPENPNFSAERRFPGQAAEFDLAQEVMGLFLQPLKQRISETEFESRRLTLTQAILEHSAQVKAAYYSLQASQQLLEMQSSVAQAREASYQSTLSMRQAGNRSSLEVQEELRELGQARINFAEAELAIAEGREKLNILLGIWGDDTRWKIPSRLPDPPELKLNSEELESQAIAERFDLAALSVEIESLRNSVELMSILSFIPSLTLTGHSEREPEGSRSTGPSLSFPIPLFDFGQGVRSRARSMLAVAEDRYYALAVEIRSEVRLHYLRMKLAQRKAEFYRRELLPTQKRLTAETQRRYNGMFVGVFDLLKVKEAEIQAGGKYIESLRDYWMSRAELEANLGRALPTPIPSSPAEPKPQNEMSHHAHHHGG